jgi:ribosomal-protein-alanine N-acetyltransferase
MEREGKEIKQRLKIQTMCPDDVPVVVELEKQNFSIPWSAQSFRSVLDDEFSYGLVGILDGKIIAYAVFGVLEDYAELWNIAVDEQYRRMGIGESMLCYIIGTCRESGVYSLFLQVRESNETAQNLYQKNDFTFVMVQKNYYHSPTEDALVFRLDIQSAG